MLPAAWGLKGKSKEIAKAEYELTGFELKDRLLDIEKDSLKEKDFKTKKYDLMFEYGKIDKFQHLRLLSDLITDDKQRAVALLEIDYKEGKITEIEYQKNSATLRNEPWVTVLKLGVGGKGSLEGSFELDWNDLFIEDLNSKGYVGTTPDNIVNQWFMEICRNVAMEEFDGSGNFSADSAANLETMKRWNSVESSANGRKGYN